MNHNRLVPTVNAAVAVAMVGLLAAVALVAHPSRLPGIAEFAPQASKPITKAPLGLTVAGGSCLPLPRCSARPSPSVSTSGARSGQGSVLPKPLAEGVPSSLTCIQWPDGSVTQTFDPQSPACIASWPVVKGNGGSTARGVTGSTIKVAVLPSQIGHAQWEALAAFFNTHYQLYGRRIVLDFHKYGGGPLTAMGQTADARTVEQARPFAVTHYIENGSSGVFPQEVAKRGVLYAGAIDQSYDTSTDASRLAPFLWSLRGFFDERQRDTAAFICSSLAHRPATLSGMASVNGAAPTRSFALLRPTYTDRPSPSAASIVETLAGCGVNVKVVDYDAKRTEEGATSDYQATLAQIMVDLRRSGITSVILQAGANHWFPLLTSAQSVAFEPEWLRWGTCTLSDDSARSYPPEQLRHVFGAWGCAKSTVFAEMPSAQALQAMRVGYDPLYAFVLTYAYDSLGLIAAGAQLAGPALTAQSFAAGLQAAQFPNPGAGQAPSWQGRIDPTSGGHSILRDYALTRWSSTARSSEDGRPGTWCYVDRGHRFSTSDGWPASDAELVAGPTPCR